MTFGYKVNGSNTLFLVWGIFVLIFGGITAITFLIGFFALCAGASSDVVSFASSVNDDVKMSIALLFVLYIVIGAVLISVKLETGILLVKENFRSTWKIIFCAVLYFLAALGNLFLMIFNLVTGSQVKGYHKAIDTAVAFVVIWYIVKIVWDILTGIFLIVKQGRLVPITEKDFIPPQPGPFSPIPIPGPEPNPFPPAPSHPILPPSPPFPSDFTVPNTPVVGTIVGLFGVFQGQTFELHSGEVCRIGRESVCNIQIKHPKVSRVHCTVCRLSDGMYQITDTSTNGTFYNNKRLEKNVPTKVSPGGTLVVGEADNVLQLNVN